jgi:hypothetical protein
MGLGRVRGVLLRLVLNRRVATALGVLVATPGLVLLGIDRSWESWLTDGLALVLLATGAALIAAGVAGRKPDWIE